MVVHQSAEKKELLFLAVGFGTSFLHGVHVRYKMIRNEMSMEDDTNKGIVPFISNQDAAVSSQTIKINITHNN